MSRVWDKSVERYYRDNGALSSAGQEAATEFVTADSVPVKYAVSRSIWVTPIFLLVFASLSAVTIANLDSIKHFYSVILGWIVDIPPQSILLIGNLAFRPFFWILLTLLGLFASGTLTQRVKITLSSWLLYGAVMLLIDLMLLRLTAFGAPTPFSALGGILVGFAGVFVIVFNIFAWYQLPAGIRVNTRVHRSSKYTLVAGLSFTFVAAAVAGIFTVADNQLEAMRTFAVLGGLGPGILLFFPILTAVLFAYGVLDRRFYYHSLRRKIRHTRHWPSVAFLVPGYNEEERIADCIKSLKWASVLYPGRTKLYVVDNASKDNTSAVARRAIADTNIAFDGVVLYCGTPGKARALNYGISNIKEDIVVRVDADTVVRSDLLQKMIPYFLDPQVGAVGGRPLPKKPTSLMGRIRTVEVIDNFNFKRIAQNSLDAVMVLTGRISGYRRELLEELDGFGEGFNGEDTDITIRIGRLGYRIVLDPNVVVFSDEPKSVAHLREQRLRWSRSAFHVVSRNASALWMGQGMRGIWAIPSTIFGICRRAIVVPIVVYALVAAIVDPSALFLRHGAAIVAVLVGPQLFLMAGALIVNRKFSSLPFIPAYLIFRLFRAYIALESLQGLAFKRVLAEEKEAVPATVSTARVAVTYESADD